MKKYLYILAAVLLASSCTDRVHDAVQVNELPAIYPDYVGVTIPADIAPMDYDIIDGKGVLDASVECVDVTVKGSKGGEIHSTGDFMDLDIDEWHALTQQNKGGKLTFTTCVKRDGKWTQYKPFTMSVSTTPLDEWGLTYRRVAPGYEVYSHMGLYQRDLSTFDEYEVIDNNRVPGACVNCHTSNRTNPKEFLFHVRGDNGATAIQKDGVMEMLNTKTDSTLGLCVYPYWHPDGRYVVFSTNTTRQEYHVVSDKRIEVFDHKSDLQVYDTEKHQLILSPLVKDTMYNESFPAFSADGKTIYFCRTVLREYPRDTEIVRYNLCSIAFDAAKGTYGDSIQTLINAEADSMSISIPKPSYDGRYIMYTLAKYGTFPIWHREADLWLLDLRTGDRHPLKDANSPDTESYHNWSTNSHWFVFSSRRDDGLYTRLYISSVDDKGNATKPFMVPQRNPRHFYDRLMYSYNVPDFTSVKVDVDSRAIAHDIVSPKRTGISVRK